MRFRLRACKLEAVGVSGLALRRKASSAESLPANRWESNSGNYLNLNDFNDFPFAGIAGRNQRGLFTLLSNFCRFNENLKASISAALAHRKPISA